MVQINNFMINFYEAYMEPVVEIPNLEWTIFGKRLKQAQNRLNIIWKASL